MVKHTQTNRRLVSTTTLKIRTFTAQKMKFCTKDFFSKCEQFLPFLRISLHVLKRPFLNGKLHFLCSVIAAILLNMPPITLMEYFWSLGACDYSQCFDHLETNQMTSIKNQLTVLNMIRASVLNKPNWIVAWVSLTGKFTL